MSLTTNRIALAPIKESHLNSTPSSNASTPKKRPSLVSMNKQFAGNFSKKKADLITRSFTISESATSLSKTFSPFQSLSFSDSRSTSNNSSSSVRIKVIKPNNQNKNDAAGLAATKLKLKLQLALYKIQQKQSTITRPITKNTKMVADETTTIKFNSATSLKFLSPPNSAKSSSFTSPTRQTPVINPIGEFASLPTPPEPRNYSSSVNINLETKTKLLAAVNNEHEQRPSLSKIAHSKQLSVKRRIQKLKLYQIRKDSIFYSDNNHGKLPLVPGETNTNPIRTSSSNSLNIATAGPTFSTCSNGNLASMINTTNSLIFPFATNSTYHSATNNNHPDSTSPKAKEASSLPSILLNPPGTNQSFSASHATYLPSINKILRTPIKKANSTRYYQQNIANNNNHSGRLTRLHTTSDDTTIDEDVDMTIINNTTTVEHDTTIAERNDGDEDEEDDDEDEDDMDARKKSVLSSSPLPNHFGTPNSFSIAKSLLQLGGHQM